MSHTVIAYDGGVVTALDQRALPAQAVQIELTTLEQVVAAIKTLAVRGAPLIGVTAAYGFCVALSGAAELEEARRRAPDILASLRASRPTAVNLFWALDRMEHRLASVGGGGWREQLESEARDIHQEVRAQDEAMARHGETLLTPGAEVITHCNTGALATGGQGTALGVLMQAHRNLGGLHVFVDETRPRWQGAHLTTWELANQGVPHTLISDNAAAALMSRRSIHSAWVGADRIAVNGDTANKIGTYSLALAARHHGVPFYVAAPSSTIDQALESGEEIPIEERGPEEVAEPHGIRIAPTGTPVWNPAFDVTPAALISAIVTEKGIYRGTDYNLRLEPV